MIDIKNIKLDTFYVAMKAMRNSYSNWNSEISEHFIMGKDFELLKKLVKAGDSHSKCLRFINVTMDIIAPLYWWKQFDTYKVGTVCVSTSTMHTITKKPFTIDNFSHEHLSDEWKEKYNLVKYNIEYGNTPKTILDFIIDALNIYRNMYLRTGEKKYWYQIIQILPSSYNQMRTVQLNYQTILNIIKQRNGHKLNEWYYFIEEMYKLPYIKELSEV